MKRDDLSTEITGVRRQRLPARRPTRRPTFGAALLAQPSSRDRAHCVVRASSEPDRRRPTRAFWEASDRTHHQLDYAKNLGTEAARPAWTATSDGVMIATDFLPGRPGLRPRCGRLLTSRRPPAISTTRPNRTAASPRSNGFSTSVHVHRLDRRLIWIDQRQQWRLPTSFPAGTPEGRPFRASSNGGGVRGSGHPANLTGSAQYVAPSAGIAAGTHPGWERPGSRDRIGTGAARPWTDNVARPRRPGPYHPRSQTRSTVCHDAGRAGVRAQVPSTRPTRRQAALSSIRRPRSDRRGPTIGLPVHACPPQQRQPRLGPWTTIRLDPLAATALRRSSRLGRSIRANDPYGIVLDAVTVYPPVLAIGH